jgi:hypothetical protein
MMVGGISIVGLVIVDSSNLQKLIFEVEKCLQFMVQDSVLNIAIPVVILVFDPVLSK